MQVSLLEIKKLLSAEALKINTAPLPDDELSSALIAGVSSLEEAKPSDITFYNGGGKNIDAFARTQAGACLISLKDVKRDELVKVCSANLYLIAVANVDLAFAKLMNLFYADDSNDWADPADSTSATDLSNLAHEVTISPRAFIESSAILGSGCHVMAGAYIGHNARIGRNVRIYPNASLGNSVVIGDNCRIYPSVTIMNAVLGSGCIIHSGVCIGKDGFKYATDDKGKHIKVAHRGLVRLGDEVEIGANCTIDRGVLSDTVIENMCKLDNLVQIGHNVTLGRGCIIVSQVGIAGSSKLGQYAVLGGQVGVADHVTIGDRAMIAAQSGIMSEVPAGSVVMGSPAQPIREFFRQVATLKRLIKGKKEND